MTNDEQTERDELLEDLDTQAAEDGDIAARAAAGLIRAQAERIAELEGRETHLVGCIEEWKVARKQAHNDALREAALVVDDKYAAGEKGNPGHHILALIKEPTT